MTLDEFPIHKPRPSDAPTTLRHIRVIDFSHFIAGPFASLMLANMGADVIKIESPTGDKFRHYPPHRPEMPDQGGPFMWANRNKRSIALDLKTDEGLKIARALVAEADVVLENFSTGVMDRYGLGYESCRKDNEKLIYCSVSAYGRQGEFADRVAFDPIVQAESGFMSLNGYADREGVRTLAPVMDMSTALLACNAILGALLARQHMGKGQLVEVALFDSALLMTGYIAQQNLLTGHVPERHGNTGKDTSPTGTFRCKDRTFFLNTGTDAIFKQMVGHVLGRPDVASDPDYVTRAGRVKNATKLFAFINEAFGEQNWDHWEPRLRAAGVPYGEVRTIAEALRSREAAARALVTKIPHPKLGWSANVNLPINYSETPLTDPRPAPALGEHTDEILGDVLNYSVAEIRKLRDLGVLGAQ